MKFRAFASPFVSVLFICILRSASSAYATPGSWEFSPLPKPELAPSTGLYDSDKNLRASATVGVAREIFAKGSIGVPTTIISENTRSLSSNTLAAAALPPITNAGNDADAVTAEIQSLANSLQGDPMRIFEYVYNAIEYEHYYGSKKGAQLTLLEGAANDTDQCSLLVALLRAAGHPAQYVHEWHLIPYDNVAAPDAFYTAVSWLALATDPYPGIDVEKPVSSWSDLDAKKTVLLSNYFDRGGFPTMTPTANPGHILARRMVVKATVAGTVYKFDPSAKQVGGKAALNLAALSGFTSSGKNAFLNAVGGTISGSGISGLDTNAVKTKVTNHATTLTTALRGDASRRSDTVADVLGNKTVSQISVGLLQSWCDFYNLPEESNIQVYGNALPASLMSKLKLSVDDGTALEILMPSLQGRRLALTASGNTIRLHKDDVVSTLATVSGSSYTLKMTAVHPNIATESSTGNTYRKNNNFHYALIYGFSGGKRFLDYRRKVLDGYYNQARATSGAVNADGTINLSALPAGLKLDLTLESLNVMGQDWLYQTEMTNRMAASLNNMNVTMRHRFGRMGLEEGFYIDVGLQLASSFPKDGTTGNSIAYMTTLGFLASALEHGIIDQYNGVSDESVSTIQTFYRAITSTDVNRKTIYRATSANWSVVKSQLVDYATDALPATLDADTVLYVPRNANNGADNWTWNGSGYVSLTSGSTPEIGMIISGDYSGGWSTSYTDYNPISVVSNSLSMPSYYDLGTSLATPVSYPGISNYIPVHAADPVDLATGAFTCEKEDLSLGAGGTRGLSFTRHYNSNSARGNDAGLGHGWTHSYDMKAVLRSATEAGLGMGAACEAAPMLAAAAMVNELVKEHTGPASTGDLKPMVAAALVSKVAIDNLLNNAVSVQLGRETHQFIKQPDGTWTPPPGSTHTLAVTDTAITLQERHGNIWRFDRNNGGRVTEIEDPYGKKLTFTYAANRLSRVTDAASRTLTLAWQNDLLRTVTDSTGRTVEYSHDSTQNLTVAKDPDGGSETFEYDAEHRITRQKDALGRTLLVNTYNADGQVTAQQMEGNATKTWTMAYTGLRNTETDPEGHTKTYAYDKRGRLLAHWDARGVPSLLLYDGFDRVIEQRLPRYNGESGYLVTRREFDVNGNLVKETDPLDRITTYAYDSRLRLTQTTVTDPATGATRTSRLEYDAGNTRFRPDRTVDAKGNITVMTYTADGALLTTRAPGQTAVTTWTYDSRGMPERVTWPDGSISKTVYDARGDLVSSTDQNNRTTTYAWNNRRLPTQATLPGGATLAQEYDACGNLTKSIDALDIATTFTWSVSGELLASTSASGTPEAATTTHAWYNNGWGKSITDPLGRTTTFAYDEAGNLAKVTDPLGRVSQNLFDAAGALNWTKTPRGHTTLFNYTSDGALLVSQDPAGGQTWNTYNGFGEQTALRNRRGAIYAFEYDANGNPTRLTTPTGKSASTTWNVRDLVAQHTKASGGETSYTYDTVGRVTQQADGAGTITFGYDAKGNPLTVSEGGGGGTLTRTFDELDRVESYSNANNETIGYSYNAGGQLTRLTYPDGKTVDYTYTALGQLKTLTDWANRTTTYEWDKAGRLIKIVRPNGTHRENRYDQAGQLISFQERDGSGQLLAYGGYSYDADGNMTTRLRLPQAAAGSAGALLAMTAGYDADNRMAQWNGLSVVHDADGNMTSGPLSLSGPPESPTISLSNYSYDARNRLVSVGSTSYGYDAENNRISQTTTEGTTHYTVDPHGDALSRVLVRTKPDGTKTHYVYGLGLAYEVNDSAAPAYYHFDHLGSTVALTDATGTVTDRVEYGVYGHIAYRSGSTDTPYLYVGQLGVQTDANGLTYMRARYFNSLLMRFVNADPVGFSGGSNWYAYADNNPMQLVDPSGFIAGSIGSNFKAILYEAITYIPVIGNLVQSVNAASQGNYWQAAGYLGLAVLDVIPPAKLVSTTVKVAHVASTASRVASSAKTAVRISESGLLRSSNKLMGVERASDNLMVAIGSRRDLRTGNDIVRLLDMQKAEAAMFDGTNLILHRPNPSKAAMLEEFLHGTQSKLGLTSRPGFNAEAHVKSFMIRHQKMLGLSAADVEILQQLMNSGL